MDDEPTIESLIADMIAEEVSYVINQRLENMQGHDVLVVYGPAVPGPMGPMGIGCDNSRLDDLERRIQALEQGD